MSESISFPDMPRAELERSIDELTARAVQMKQSEGRLRALLRATRAVVEDIDLSIVLRRIVEAAVELVDSEYGALGVVGADGSGLEAFIHVGMTADDADRIGHLPEGRGLLGAVISAKEPIRIDRLADDPRSSGFPVGHPPMDAFLGVPIRIRGVVYGNLYLTNPRTGPFTAEDEELLEALAATAAFAIDHARILIEARTRERWMTSSAEIAVALGRADSEQAVSTLADELFVRSDSERVVIVVPGEKAGTLHVAAARGADAASLAGRTLASGESMAGAVLDIAVSRIEPEHHSDSLQDPFLLCNNGSTGPAIYITLGDGAQVWGVLVAARSPSRPPFTKTDLEAGVDLGERISVALELARARDSQQKMKLMEDRSRIAQDLHDHVIQDLFGTGLELQSISSTASQADRWRLDEAVTRIDGVIAQIRKIVFALAPRDAGQTASVRHRILDLAADASKALPRPVDVSFSGPVDLFVSGALVDDVVAVTRELLSNVVKHADPLDVSVDVTVATEDIQLTVTDDGGGIPANVHRSGLVNVEKRATDLGGGVDVTSSSSGTRVVWRIPITEEVAR
ncbi:GAF domain-containing protein [Agreia bicolorata]|uniref:GAF domain-containing protein n=1 Tax=Agreia bicolorata TaxID=110935 RepID=A0A1T4YDA5_9MICO|nr:GAF domain-containing protein [Agreia bicolorata]SKA99680.1 GAF domain-containing protein [Agreia bicolorata]